VVLAQRAQAKPFLEGNPTQSTGRGHALIGRALYLPEACAADEEHRELTGVPEEVMFAAKPQLVGGVTPVTRRVPSTGLRIFCSLRLVRRLRLQAPITARTMSTTNPARTTRGSEFRATAASLTTVQHRRPGLAVSRARWCARTPVRSARKRVS
jgi:hypothetical protein